MARILGVPDALKNRFKSPPFEIWDCNWDTFLLFGEMSTQWRIGMNGPTGLDLSVLPQVAWALRIKLTRAHYKGIRSMETAALKIMRDRK